MTTLTVCAWCGTPPPDVDPADISHTICEACLEREYPEEEA